MRYLVILTVVGLAASVMAAEPTVKEIRGALLPTKEKPYFSFDPADSITRANERGKTSKEGSATVHRAKVSATRPDKTGWKGWLELRAEAKDGKLLTCDLTAAGTATGKQETDADGPKGEYSLWIAGRLPLPEDGPVVNPPGFKVMKTYKAGTAAQ